MATSALYPHLGVTCQVPAPVSVAVARSPSPVDRWHDREGYTGARRASELVALEPRSASETSFTAELPTDD